MITLRATRNRIVGSIAHNILTALLKNNIAVAANNMIKLNCMLLNRGMVALLMSTNGVFDGIVIITFGYREVSTQLEYCASAIVKISGNEINVLKDRFNSSHYLNNNVEIGSFNKDGEFHKMGSGFDLIGSAQRSDNASS